MKCCPWNNPTHAEYHFSPHTTFLIAVAITRRFCAAEGACSGMLKGQVLHSALGWKRWGPEDNLIDSFRTLELRKKGMCTRGCLLSTVIEIKSSIFSCIARKTVWCGLWGIPFLPSVQPYSPTQIYQPSSSNTSCDIILAVPDKLKFRLYVVSPKWLL